MTTKTAERHEEDAFSKERLDAIAHAKRAQQLRQEAKMLNLMADEEDRKANEIYTSITIKQRGLNSHNAKRRPHIDGNPKLAVNRVIALMEILNIDEDACPVEGLNYPLEIIERKLGIRYSRWDRPLIGKRISSCEAAIAQHS